MSDLSFVLDVSGFQVAAEQMKALDGELRRGAQLLAAQAHAHIVQQVQTRLHTRRSKYLEALIAPKEVSDGIWMITLDSSASWIEQGMPAHSLVDDLLRRSPRGNSKSGPKTAKDGSTYRVIPFEHAKIPSKQTQAEQVLTSAIKQELKRIGVSWGKKEASSSGAPRTGHIRDLFMDTPNRPQFAVSTPNRGGGPGSPPNQHGFGSGEIGKPMVGPTGRPFLEGLRMYQHPIFQKDKNGEMKPKLNKQGFQDVSKSAVTFRIVSSKHRGVLWEHPGCESMGFFEEALRWIKDTWDRKMLPDLMRKYNLQ